MRISVLVTSLCVFLNVVPAMPLEKTEPGQMRLQITETAGVDRTAWPVTSGIPFPKGAVKDEQQVALLDASGKEVPLQTTVLSRYWEADSSIRLETPNGGKNL